MPLFAIPFEVVDDFSFGHGCLATNLQSLSRRETQKVDFRPLVLAAGEGNLWKIQSLLLQARSEVDKRVLLNDSARQIQLCCHSCPHNISGDEDDWCHGLTPLAAAALKRRSDVVEQLLREGADPTLQCQLSPGLQLTPVLVEAEELDIRRYVESDDYECLSMGSKQLTSFLLHAAAPFWQTVRYSSCLYTD
jgi:hypothetical protein